MQSDIYWQHPKLPIRIERILMNRRELNIHPAQAELENYIQRESDGNSMTWGYFPELNPDPKDYPATIALEQRFKKTILDCHPIFSTLPLEPAFVRRAVAEPKSDFGGFHIDASSGIGHHWPKDVSLNKAVLRLLFNLGETPRTLAYYPYTLEELQARNISIDREHYEMLQLPRTLTPAVIDIPPIETDAIYGLSFISTEVPHAGQTTSTGHFLISYGAYIDKREINRIFAE